LDDYCLNNEIEVRYC